MTQLHERLDRLRREARRALVVRGLCWVVVFSFSACLIAGWIDWVWHIAEQTRLALGLAMLAGVGWLSWRMLVKPLLHALSNVELAIKIERRYPEFRDSLASTVQFESEHADPRLGSPELQRRVIAQTMPLLEAVDLDAVIEHRGVRRAATFAFGVSLLVLGVVGFNQSEAATAVRRLLFPYSAGEWDRETQLQLLDAKLETIRFEPGQPFRRVQGDTFRVYVENLKGELPEDTVLEVRDGDGEMRREKLRKLVVSGKGGKVHHLGTANLLLERGPMYFRATGGDDREMVWHRLEVVPAPRIDEMRVTLTPPAYSGRKAESLPKGVGHVRALVGTEIRITAKSRTPLRFARLRVKSDAPRKAKLSSDGKQIDVTFRLTDHGNYSYWFELKDRQGFDNPNSPRYDIRAIRDRVPTVRVVEPPRNARVTKDGVVPIRVVAEDDLGLSQVAIRYRTSLTREGVLHSLVLADPQKPYRWRMSQIDKVTEGVQIRFHVEALDRFNLGKNGLPDPLNRSKHVGKSLTRTITIVSPQEKTGEIAREYGSLLEELARIAKQQQQAHDDVSQLLVQLEKAGRLRVERDLPILRRAERAQREINMRLSEAGGVEQRATGLIEELRNNRLDEPVLRGRLIRIAAELVELRKRVLPQIEADLTISRKNADEEVFAPAGGERKNDSRDQQQRLNAVTQGQTEVLQQLNKLIAELREWRNWQNLSTDLDDLIKTQESLHHKSLILKSSTFGLTTGELKDQQKADLAKLAEGQRRLADRVDRFQKDIAGFLDALNESARQNPAAVRTLSDALQYVRDQKLFPRMRGLSQQIDANRLNLATTEQETLIDELGELKAILENRGASDLETLIKQQRAAEQELSGLEKQQEELFKQAEAARGMKDPRRQSDELKKLVKRQETLQRRLNQMAGRLRRLLAVRANDAARRAARGMGRAAASLQRRDWEANRLEQKETLEQLEQARRELARTRRQAEEQLARQMLERIAGELKGIIKRQQNVVGETERLKNQYARAGEWTRGLLMTLDSLKEEQLALRSRIQNLSKKTQAAAVFSSMLRSIAAAMQSAVLDLSAANDTPATLESALKREQGVLESLVKLLETIAEPPPRPRDPGTAPDGGQGGAQKQDDAELISQITQLKLLKAQQERLLEQTKELHKTRQPGMAPTDATKQAIEQIANRQAELADLAARLAPGKAPVVPIPESKTDPKVNRVQAPPILPDKDTNGTKLPLAELHRRVISGMRSAAGKLTSGETGKPLQDMQQKVLDDLDRLIRQAQQQRRQSSSGASGAKQPSSAKRKVKSPGAKQSNAKSKKAGKSPKKGSSGTEKKRPKDSDPGTRNRGKADSRIRNELRSALIREFWGHLPTREKQRLRNVAGDVSLPKYKQQNNRYFESLAED